MKKSCSYDKAGIRTLADDKPCVYRIQDQRGRDNFVGAAKRGRVSDCVSEHLGVIPGATVRIMLHDSLEEAKATEQRIINREKPKYNQRNWLGQDRLVRREAGSRERLAPATEGGPNPSDQPVTGSASPSAYHGKLAEELAAIPRKLFGRDTISTSMEAVVEDRIAAVLASATESSMERRLNCPRPSSEGVVRKQSRVDRCSNCKDAKAKIERLEAALKDACKLPVEFNPDEYDERG